tara:strand:- start:97 stop:864 length:768 start_codon:yes stop_codon:yes gene_type:complete
VKKSAELYQNLEIRNIDHNNIGIFTNKDIKKGEIIELAPFVTDKYKPPSFNKNAIYIENKYWLIILGYGSIYRIFYKDFNADIKIPDDNKNDIDKFITISANRDIKKGEEIILDSKYFGLDIKNINQYYQNIYLDTSEISGRGVFAGKNFSKDEVIEIVYFLADKMVEGRSAVADYIIGSNFEGNSNLMLGYASLYNHSDDPNSQYLIHQFGLDKISSQSQFIKIKAKKDIKKGEELTISYGENYWKSRKKKVKK